MGSTTIPVLGAPLHWGPFEYAGFIWLILFWGEVLTSALDGQKNFHIDGWNAFKYGVGIAMPAWALSQGELGRLLPAHGQWWQHSWYQYVCLGLGVAISLWMWLGEPLRGQVKWSEALLPSKVYFQLMTIEVVYLLAALLVACLWQVGVLASHFHLPLWAVPVTLAVLASIYVYAWSIHKDWGDYIGPKRPVQDIVLWQFGLAGLVVLGFKLAIDPEGLLTIARTLVTAAGFP